MRDVSLAVTQLLCYETGISRNLHRNVVITNKGVFPDHAASQKAWHLNLTSPDIVHTPARLLCPAPKIGMRRVPEGQGAAFGVPTQTSSESNPNDDPRIC